MPQARHRSRLWFGSVQGMVIQGTGTIALVGVAVTFFLHGNWPAGVVFGFIALFPLGGLLSWVRVLQLGRRGRPGRQPEA